MSGVGFTRLAALAMCVALAAGGCSNESAPAPASSAAASRPAVVSTTTRVTGKAPSQAIVTLEAAVPRDFAAPTDRKAMDQFGQQFSPGVLLARVGQPVDFRNSEDVLHNVRVDDPETRTTVFNVATPPFEVYTHTFDKPGSYNVSCDVHPAMRANIVVTATPYATVAGSDGSFAFLDVLAGEYKVTVFAGPTRVERVVSINGAQMELQLDAR